MERLLAPYIISSFSDRRQFAYKQDRGTDDALMMLLNVVTEHIDRDANNYLLVVLVNFSSASHGGGFWMDMCAAS